MAMSGASPNHSPKPGVPSPWSQIVAAAAPPSSPPLVDSSAVKSAPAEDSDNGHNVNAGKRTAWNKPSNGASSSVMGADSWPALSESARAPAKSPSPSPSESAKAPIDASSIPPLQGTGSVVPSPQRQARDNASVSNSVPTYQKSFKRSNSNTSANGGHPGAQLSVHQGSMAATGSHNYNSSPRDHQTRAGFVSADHPQQRNSFRHRNGGGPHQRADGGHHHNYGGRRDHDRGNSDWNAHRNFNGRDNYMSQRYMPRFMRPPPPPNPAQLFPPPPPPMRPFGGSVGFPELPPHVVYVPSPPLDTLRGVPFVSPIPPNAIYFQPPDPQLHTKIVNQIDYYFSSENLVKDIYLRRNMDEQGWVSINLIAGFKKVRYLTDSVQIVLEAVRTSSVVEVQETK
ncbi:la-related protein 1C-like isoform X2 [Abrus precatorius]|uniref:La-related protein 1C-like isoform X2 n=1 Tax=Abrus precatorius TaxID=3816 RepID=A0A8B8KVL3_ABRPR|nr:la-related protein 1C-like isoform X2 [Abrus precatorius]